MSNKLIPLVMSSFIYFFINMIHFLKIMVMYYTLYIFLEGQCYMYVLGIGSLGAPVLIHGHNIIISPDDYTFII